MSKQNELNVLLSFEDYTPKRWYILKHIIYPQTSLTTDKADSGILWQTLSDCIEQGKL